MDKRPAKGNSPGTTAQSTRESSSTTRSTVLEPTSGQMEERSMASGRRTRCMERVRILGKTGGSM